jgi:hypothetical protein
MTGKRPNKAWEFVYKKLIKFPGKPVAFSGERRIMKL